MEALLVIMDYKKLYSYQPEDFYLREMSARGIRAVWFRARQKAVTELVRQHYQGGLILDIGCGNSLWNVDRYPVVGLDICQNMLQRNRRDMPFFYPLKADFFSPLPIKKESVSMVVITEVLEHMAEYHLLVKEVRRVLKPDGVIVVSVPYEEFPGVWRFLFSFWCAFKAWRDNDEYYRNRCGHTVRFGPARLRQAFTGLGKLKFRALYFLTVLCVVSRDKDCF